MTPLTKAVTRRATVRVPHGVRPEIIVTLYPNGDLGLREARRPSRTEQRLGELYVMALKDSINRAAVRQKELVRKNGMTRSQARKQARNENGL